MKNNTPATLSGVGGAPGIAIGPAFCFQPAPPADRPTIIDAGPDAALERLTAARAEAAARLRALAERQRADGHPSEGDMLDAQALLVEDDFITDEVGRLLREEHQTLDEALDATIAQMHDAMAALDDEYLRDRADDMTAIGKEIRRALYGAGASLADAPSGAIVVAADLTPAETVELPPDIGGFATAYGGPTGHTAILARSRGIPAVVGLGEAALDIREGAALILDGAAARLTVEPDAATLASYEQLRDQQRAAADRRQGLRDLPGQLADGQPIALWANIGRPADARSARTHGAEGIGLFRTEFLFLDRSSAPSEDEQFAAYRETLEIMDGRTVVVRTLDIGGDKPVPYIAMPHEANPFLGVRGLRLCMRYPELFGAQLRALLRAACYGDLWIMLPMVATPEDLAWGREQLRAAAAALEAAGTAHRADVKLGIMIETPAAAITADLLAQDAAFFSIGSNDLTQYTMAADRGAAELAARYEHSAPAVLRMIKQAADAAARAGIPVGVCGDLAGEQKIVAALAGLGVAELSMAPALIPTIKEYLRSITPAEAHAAAEQALAPHVR